MLRKPPTSSVLKSDVCDAYNKLAFHLRSLIFFRFFKIPPKDTVHFAFFKAGWSFFVGV